MNKCNVPLLRETVHTWRHVFFFFNWMYITINSHCNLNIGKFENSYETLCITYECAYGHIHVCVMSSSHLLFKLRSLKITKKMKNQNISFNDTQKKLKYLEHFYLVVSFRRIKHCLVFITIAAPIISLLMTVNMFGLVMHSVLY